MPLIGVMGALGSGKTTLAERLVERHGFVRLCLADGLKDMLRCLGLAVQQVDGHLKEAPSGLLCGKTPRHAMQTLGTEWGRRLIGDDLWVNVLRERIMAEGPGARLVVDDVRFPNEAALIRELGGELWVVRRPAVEPSAPPWRLWAALRGVPPRWLGLPHLSELHWMDLQSAADVVMHNDGDLAKLLRSVDWAWGGDEPPFSDDVHHDLAGRARAHGVI